MKKFKDAEDFYNNSSREDYKQLNEWKMNWYEERPYMDIATKKHDFYNEALKQGLIESNKQVTVEYFENIRNEKAKNYKSI